MPLLSVLDQSPVRSGGTPADAIHESLELAELADRLGYHRYWLAEHHSTPGLGGSSPEVLIGQVAARTSRIRVGAGGVMLQHASALKVAETFRVLETLFPGRIDLGIGRAPGADHLTTLALEDRGGDVSSEWGTERRSAPAAFPRQVADVIGFLRASFPEGHRYGKVIAMPSRSEEHTSELQSQSNLVCRLLLEKKKNTARSRCSPQLPRTLGNIASNKQTS